MMTREERDTHGVIDVPDEHLWGAQTQRALIHFAISTERMPGEIVRALAAAKGACAKVNGSLGLLPLERARAIVAAADEVQSGQHDTEFPLSLWQAGSGTQTNMNLNEVLARRATELLGAGRTAPVPIHPNDEVNLGQSSNDIFPTAMHLAASAAIAHSLLPSLARLRATLKRKSNDFAGIVKIGRTHLQDAVPLTLGQAFSAYVAQLAHAESALVTAMVALYPLAIGGTAVGTGLNTHPEFGKRVAAELRQSYGLPFTSAENKFAALAAHDGIVTAHAALRTLATVLLKIANDIRWLASGPRAGLGEIAIPANEPGSSMMPGKVNPTQCEALIMICCQVMGNDVAVGMAGSLGNFELNACKPLLANSMLQSLRLLADGMTSFERHCARGIEARRERIGELLRDSLMLVTALAPHIGYDRAAEIALKAQREGGSLRAAAMALGYVDAEQFDRWVNPAAMTGLVEARFEPRPAPAQTASARQSESAERQSGKAKP